MTGHPALRPRQQPPPRPFAYRPRVECRNAAAYWLRYALTEPWDAAYTIPHRLACRLLRSHNTTCRGRPDHPKGRRTP